MKKALIMLLAASLALPSCMPQKKPPTSNSGTVEETTTEAEMETDDSATKIAYYEQLVNELQEELLNIKTELYVSRVEYESRLEELKKEPESTTPPQQETPLPTTQFTYIQKDGTITVTGYTGDEKQITVPSVIDDLPVTAIADRAFAGNSKLTSVSIPEGVINVGWFAFSGCVGMKNLMLPSSVKVIEYGAFENCNTSMTVTCPEGSYAQQYARSYGFATVSA